MEVKIPTYGELLAGKPLPEDLELMACVAQELKPLHEAIEKFLESPTWEAKSKVEKAIVVVATNALFDGAEAISDFYEENAMSWGNDPFAERLADMARHGTLHLVVAEGERRLQEQEEAHQKYRREHPEEFQNTGDR